MIYLWLEHLKIMHMYKTHEEFQRAVDYHQKYAKENIQNQCGFMVFIEADTPYWDD